MCGDGITLAPAHQHLHDSAATRQGPEIVFFTRGRLRPVKANTLLKYSNSPSASRPMPCPNDIEFGSKSQLALSEFLRTEKTLQRNSL